jgi:hypothetical protein
MFRGIANRENTGQPWEILCGWFSPEELIPGDIIIPFIVRRTDVLNRDEKLPLFDVERTYLVHFAGETGLQ